MGGWHVGLVNDSINVEWDAHHGNGIVTWHGWLTIDARALQLMHRLKHSNFLIFLCLILVRLYVKVPLQVTLPIVYQQIQIPASGGHSKIKICDDSSWTNFPGTIQGFDGECPLEFPVHPLKSMHGTVHAFPP